MARPPSPVNEIRAAHPTSASRSHPAMNDVAANEDEDDVLDFGNWCPVCDRAIPPPLSATATGSKSPTLPPSAKSRQLPQNANGDGPAAADDPWESPPKHRPPREPKMKKAVVVAAVAGIGPKRKSSTRLHTAGRQPHHHHHQHHPSQAGAATRRTASHASLASLSPTATTTAKATATATTTTTRASTRQPPSPASDVSPDGKTLNPPTSLYCSDECRRIDEMRSRLAFADLHASPHAAAAVATDSERRRSSSVLSSLGLSDIGNASSDALDSLYRGVNRRRSSRGSTDSLSSMTSDDIAEHRPHTHTHSHMARQPSALSSFRLMTPISPPSPTSNPHHFVTRPSMLQRSHTDHPPATALRKESPARASSTERPHDPATQKADSREGVKITSPPAPSPRVLEGGSGSAAGQSHFGVSVSDVRFPSLDPQTASTQTRVFPWQLPRTGVSTAMPTPALRQVELAELSAPRPLTLNSRNSASSASLALLSFGSDRSGEAWAQPKRTGSTASLSSLVAHGSIIPTGELSQPTTIRRARGHHQSTSSIRHTSVSPSSPSDTSNSSFAHSHSSNRSQRSTAGSSDHAHTEYGFHARNPSTNSLVKLSSRSPTTHHPHLLSSSLGSHHPSYLHGNLPHRTPGGLLMTPSTTSLGETAFNASLDHSVTRSWTSISERTPTQSLSKASTLRALANSQADLTRFGREALERDLALQDRRLEAKATSHAGGTYSSDRLTSDTGKKHEVSFRPATPLVANPALSHLAVEQPMHKSKNWSWDHLPIYVPTYAPLDLDKIRREKANRESAGRADSEEMPPPPVPRERKKLFYFSDGGD